MKFRSVIPAALTALAFAVPALAAQTSPPSVPGPSPLPLVPLGSNSEYAVVEIGTSAPDFSYECPGGWARLRDLRANGPVLLVIGADREHLLALERERPSLRALGVVPVAALDQKPSRCAATARTLGIACALVPDPQRVIAAQFNALDPNSRVSAPAWFVIDRAGHVRALGRYDWPQQSWTDIATDALDLGRGDAAPASFQIP